VEGVIIKSSNTPPKDTPVESITNTGKGESSQAPSPVFNQLVQHITDDDNSDQPKNTINFPTSDELNAFLTEQKKSFLNDNIHLGTHNIRGITRTIDQEMLIQEIWDKRIDILGLSETKLTINNQAFVFSNSKDKYKCFPSSCPNNPRGAGMLLLVHKEIEKYIVQVDKIEGHLIAINLLSKKHKT
jgi:hypothetical protein